MLLLNTKLLIPAIPAQHITRAHLVAMIRENLGRRLVMLTAPPGYGKSTLLVEAAAALERPVIWLQLDEGDNDPATFAAYLVEGICRRLPEVGQRVRHLLADSGPQPAERMLVILLNELLETPEQGWALMLDDYHLVNNPDVHRLLTMLLDNLPPGVSVIIATRTLPPLPLARWRARGQLTEIRTEHLRFSPAEAAAWLAQTAGGIPDETVQQLVERTEGWGAGLQLALNLLAGREAPAEAADFVAGLGGTHPYIFNYLMAEVFERQPPHLQDFLLRSSVLVQMNTDICEAVLGLENARPLLEQVERENLFLVSLDEARGWYRYHHLFRDFLLNRLARQDHAVLVRLQRTAGDYYAAHSEGEIAVQYYLLAGEKGAAAAGLRSFATDSLHQGRFGVLHRCLTQLDDEVERHPDLLLLHGRVLRQMGHIQEAIGRLRAAREFPGAPLDVRYHALTELASMARSQGDYQRARQYAAAAVNLDASGGSPDGVFALMELAKNEGFITGMHTGRELAEEAIRQMERAGPQINPYQQAALLRSLGQICWWHGDVQAAVTHCKEALRRLPGQQSPLAAETLMALATPCLYRHEYDTALDYAESALTICQRLQLRELLPTAYATLGNILTRVGQLTRAENSLRQAIDLAEDLGAASYAQVMAAGYLAYNLWGQGRLDEAHQIAESALWPHEGLPVVYEIYVCRSVLADIYLHSSQPARACEIFDDLIKIGEARQYRIPLAMAYFGRAYIAFIAGQREEGLALARRSLELIEPTHAWELYVDQHELAARVCGELAAALPGNAFIARVQQALEAASPRAPAVTISPEPSRRLRVEALGSFRVYRGGTEIAPRAWVSVKARDLLAYFINFRHEVIPLDRVLDSLWPLDQGGSKTAFHTALYRCRRALRSPDEAAKYILVEVGDYRLDVAQFEIDVDDFDTALQQASGAGPQQAAKWYRAALDLYHGEYMDNLYYDWVLPERARLRDQYLHALRELAALLARAGQVEEAISLTRQALREDPLLENTHCDLLRYLHQQGDRQGLARQWETLVKLLRDELGVEPLPATRRLFEQLSER